MTNEQLRQHLINAGLHPVSPPRPRNKVVDALVALFASVVFTLTAAFGVWLISASLNLGWSYWSDCVLFGMGAMTVIGSTLEYRRAVRDE